MFERGQTLKGVAERLGMNAEGVMRQAGKVLFVPGLLPGEEAEVRVESSRSRYATGSLVHLLHASADRVSPPCAHYADCGGCSCQHMRYEAQLAFKRGQVSDVLRRVGGLDVRVEETIGAASPWRYRNKTRFQIDWTGGVPRIGFFARGSRRLAAVDDCLISHPDACRSAGVFQRWMRQDGQINTKLMPTSLTVQVSSLGHVSVLAACELGGLQGEESLVHALATGLPSLCYVGLARKVEGADGNESAAIRTLYDKEPFREEMDGLSLTLSPGSFLQVNHEICARLYHYALSQATLREADTVADLYCSAGALSLMAARLCARVEGVELSARATADARHNAEASGIRNAAFHQGFAEIVFPKMLAEGFAPDAVLLDPPRRGAHPDLLKAIAAARPRTVVYISCHPPSQARDAAILCSMGYRVSAAQPFDMFCQTAEVENVLTFNQTQEAGYA